MLVLAGLLATACETPQGNSSEFTPRPVVEVGKWQVESAGEVLGQVVKLEIRDPAAPVTFFRIVDRAGRHCGEATAKGRFSRRRPDFLGGDEDLGVLPMARGVALLLEASGTVELQPVPAEASGYSQRQ